MVYNSIDKSGSNLKFYTTWNFLSLTIFFGLAALQSWLATRPGYTAQGFFARATWVLFQLNLTMVFVVDAILWGVLLPLALKNSSDATQSKSDILNFVSYNGACSVCSVAPRVSRRPGFGA